MNREKIADRSSFTEEDREDVLKKSSGVCAHCGKPIFIGYQFSIDHYIPLSKGGINRKFNLVPLCKNCNREKGHKIFDPEEYISYFKPECMKELKDYYESYIKSFNFVSKNNYLAIDNFTISAFIPIKSLMYSKKLVQTKYTVKRAEYEDLDKIYDYYVDFLKKHDSFSGEKFAKENIQFWFENGCIYYVEKNGEIKIMAAYDVVELSGNWDYGMEKSIDCYIFPKYSTLSAISLTDQMLEAIPGRISKEQGIKVIPMIISGLVNDLGFKRCQIIHDKEPCGYDFDGKVEKYMVNFGYHTDEFENKSNFEIEAQIRAEAVAFNRFLKPIEAAQAVQFVSE